MEEIQITEIIEKISIMKQIIIGFNNVIMRENEALKVNDIQVVKSLYEQKVKIVSTYRGLSAFFIKNRALLAEYESQEKEELKTLSAELDTNLKANALLLKARMEAGKKVMDTFINIAKTTNQANSTSYGSRGNYTPLDNNRNALAFNRML